MTGKLYLFTSSFPYGTGEQFLETEIKYLARTFAQIDLHPLYHNGAGMERRSVPDNVRVQKPLLPKDRLSRFRAGVVNCAPLRFAFSEWLNRRPRGYAQVKSFVKATMVTRALLSSGLVDVVRSASANDILYYYWGAGACYLLPFVPTRQATTVVRFHNFDLYEETTSGYLPFRECVLGNTDFPVTISDHGARYLRERFTSVQKQPHVFRLGTEDFGSARPSQDDVYRICSCSNISDVKRVDRIADVLTRVNAKIEWTHIGDGPLRNKVEEILAAKPPHLTVRLMGRMSNNEVKTYYRTNPVDLFVNLSTHEGVPVSIMEALSAGIPVIATDCGGVSELVTEAVGRVVPVGMDVRALAGTIENMIKLRDHRFRVNARERWREMSDAETRYQCFVDFLEELSICGCAR